MKKFHRNLDRMSFFTALLLIAVALFWKTFLNIAISNIILNGIIIGVTVFGIGLCFINMFKLLPEYKWLHAYFDGKASYGFSPQLLRPIALALHNKHKPITTSNMTELLDLVSIRIEETRDSVHYISNTLIFLGLLGTFCGLIITVGGFANLLTNVDFNNPDVLTNMQNGMTGPLSGMATAFTSSLLGLAGSLIIGFLGLQLQFAQNTIFQELTDFMSKYVLQTPGENNKSIEVSASAPVSEDVYSAVSEMYDGFIKAGYEIHDLIKIDDKFPAIIALGSNEELYIGTVNVDIEILQNVIKRFELCFADTLEGIKINIHALCLSSKQHIVSNDPKIIYFNTSASLQKYLSSHKNIRPKTKNEWDTFDAYSEYVRTTIEYLFKLDND